MRKVLLIGVGAGDPDYVTVQAIKALNTVDVFFLIDKGSAKDDLIQLRREICERHISGTSGTDYRFVQATDPERDRTAAAYGEAVKDWHHRRAEIFERMIAEELEEDGVGAILVWGDPSLYDGTIRIVEELTARGNVAFKWDVIPGVSSLHALTARHRIPLNRIGEPIHITPGRLLAEGMPAGQDNVVVMLDGECAFTQVTDPDVDIFWGAYLGTRDEMLFSGPVTEVGPQIVQARAEARERKGWVMDTYLLRRRRA
ncbi:precorrin-6A synthase (deacetylating) [Kineosporia rhizophila]|uniref:precorrin-6A synthase (deacetylating) n=1 Tax=Kineosporia TaxID=49184 RepID=UPI001E5E971E|nr:MULTISPECIES: precorrin-6A synthase (deacetylating) [Kineosporia]MCE0535615.1 precorrin-6A synthase (deacetylating) [Kineosporia rhizophila]GLY17741.1 precorrin-6A synthase (deacetylating) [Kineosporia sp. NBRC 101677]